MNKYSAGYRLYSGNCLKWSQWDLSSYFWPLEIGTSSSRQVAASNSDHYRLVLLYKEMHLYDVPSSSTGLSALVVVMAAATSASVMGVLSVPPLGSN